MNALVCECKSFTEIIQLVVTDCVYIYADWFSSKHHSMKMNFSYKAQHTSFHTATCCASSVTLMLYLLPAVSMHLLALKYAVMLHMQFPVWRSALVHTDWQSNTLTPSICSTVTSLIDVLTYVVVSF